MNENYRLEIRIRTLQVHGQPKGTLESNWEAISIDRDAPEFPKVICHGKNVGELRARILEKGYDDSEFLAAWVGIDYQRDTQLP